MKIKKLFIPLLIVAVAVGGAMYMMKTAPKAERSTPRQPVPIVEVAPMKTRDYRIKVRTQGTVEPRTQTTIVAEVSGKVIEISPTFRDGSFFQQGDLLLKIDPRDYRSAVTIAEAELAQQQVSLDTEKANSELALRDWQRLGNGGEPNDLVLRKPQLASARANLDAARARLQQARINLTRTEIRAPYSGRVLQQTADLGQFVNPGAQLGVIYATDYVEINLPVSNEQLAQLKLVERYEDQTPDQASMPAVMLTANAGEERYQWQGRIVRTSGAIDTKTRQQFLVAQVDNPYRKQDNQTPPLKIGQFVTAEVEGLELRDVYVIPATAMTKGNEIMLIDDQSRLQPRRVDVLWTTVDEAVIRTEVPAGMRLSLTPLPLAVPDMKVKVKGDPEAEEPTEKGPGKGEGKGKPGAGKP